MKKRKEINEKIMLKRSFRERYTKKWFLEKRMLEGGFLKKSKGGCNYEKGRRDETMSMKMQRKEGKEYKKGRIKEKKEKKEEEGRRIKKRKEKKKKDRITLAVSVI